MADTNISAIIAAMKSGNVSLKDLSVAIDDAAKTILEAIEKVPAAGIVGDAVALPALEPLPAGHLPKP